MEALVLRLWAWLLDLFSDDEKALRMAAADVLPGVAHQTCQLHCLRDAALPIVEADQTFKKALKQAIRGPFYAVCREIDRLAPDDPHRAVLSTYADLIRTTLTEGSKLPFALGGLRVFEDLTRLEASLQRGRKKGALQYPKLVCGFHFINVRLGSRDICQPTHPV